jgi:hypothetical protein
MDSTFPVNKTEHQAAKGSKRIAECPSWNVLLPMLGRAERITFAAYRDLDEKVGVEMDHGRDSMFAF